VCFGISLCVVSKPTRKFGTHKEIQVSSSV
jgi:hypothetical protein